MDDRRARLRAAPHPLMNAAAAFGSSRSAVYAWKKAAGKRGEGAKALAAKPQHVPMRRLSQLQRSRLARLKAAATMAIVDAKGLSLRTPSVSHRLMTRSAPVASSRDGLRRALLQAADNYP